MAADKTSEQIQKDINETLWRACDTFRGVVDPSEYKDYMLVMLFLKYISDVWKDKRDEYARKYGGDATRIGARAVSRAIRDALRMRLFVALRTARRGEHR